MPEYTEILKELREKFTESARLFKDATMAVTFEWRILTKPQEEEVIGLSLMSLISILSVFLMLMKIQKDYTKK